MSKPLSEMSLEELVPNNITVMNIQKTRQPLYVNIHKKRL